MAAVLHLFKARPTTLAEVAIAQEMTAGDRVTIALLEGAPEFQAPAGVAVHRVSVDLSYDALLEKIFEADQVIAW